ncbi:epsilon-tubulin 1, isoform CRA_a [Mus musculus]|nr:epsilon-tubulin 1, isoform CRA_a [Mus musculus]
MTQSVVVQGELPPSAGTGSLRSQSPGCLPNAPLSLPRYWLQSDSAGTRSAAASGTWR